MEEMDNITQSPLAAQVVVIDGMRLTLKWTFLAEYEADKIGLDVAQFLAGLREQNVGKVTGFMKMFVAMTAHEFVAVGRPVPGPDYWAAKLEKEPDKFREILRSRGSDAAGKNTGVDGELREPAAPSLVEFPAEKPN